MIHDIIKSVDSPEKAAVAITIMISMVALSYIVLVTLRKFFNGE